MSHDDKPHQEASVPLGTISECPSCGGDGKLHVAPGQLGPCWRCAGSGRVMAYRETKEQFDARMQKVKAFAAFCDQSEPPSSIAPMARQFPICKDHPHADWNQPALDDEACVLCRLFYLEAQESLLEEWQQRAKRAEDSIADIERPLDAQMARLNATVAGLNAENEKLRASVSATGPSTDTARLEWLFHERDTDAIMRKVRRVEDSFMRDPSLGTWQDAIDAAMRAADDSAKTT